MELGPVSDDARYLRCFSGTDRHLLEHGIFAAVHNLGYSSVMPGFTSRDLTEDYLK
jgi:hypothetical protein